MAQCLMCGRSHPFCDTVTRKNQYCALNMFVTRTNCALSMFVTRNNCALNMFVTRTNCALNMFVTRTNCTLNMFVTRTNWALNMFVNHTNCALNMIVTRTNCALNTNLILSKPWPCLTYSPSSNLIQYHLQRRIRVYCQHSSDPCTGMPPPEVLVAVAVAAACGAVLCRCASVYPSVEHRDPPASCPEHNHCTQTRPRILDTYTNTHSCCYFKVVH